jgi:hypothetical protein
MAFNFVGPQRRARLTSDAWAVLLLTAPVPVRFRFEKFDFFSEFWKDSA